MYRYFRIKKIIYAIIDKDVFCIQNVLYREIKYNTIKNNHNILIFNRKNILFFPVALDGSIMASSSKIAKK